MLLLALALGPLAGAANASDATISRNYRVVFSSFDSSMDGDNIGVRFLTYMLAANMRGINGLPKLEAVYASTPEALRAMVRSGEAAGAVWVAPSATSSLLAAVASVTAGANTAYFPANAIGFAWDEGRDPEASRVVGTGVRGVLLPAFERSFSELFIVRARNSGWLDALMSARMDILMRPVSFTEEKLFPAADSWTSGANAVFWGNALMVRTVKNSQTSKAHRK